ncbi:MAG: hypothetical protein H6Q58_1427 [Firmicutes bacterium]|nr:hypothetical protein [Bacillota bacterium]
MKDINDSNEYKSFIKEAVVKLQNREIEGAYELILNALSQNPAAPEPHNLLGALHEIRGNEDMARKHYRAAYALDPTFKPANKNLERICTFCILPHMAMDLGVEILINKK